MKPFLYFFILIASLCFQQTATACDACGCSSAGNYIGMLPAYSTSFVGLRYSFQQFSGTGTHGDELINSHSEVFHRTELWGRFYPHKRVQTLISVPYQNHALTEAGITENLSGLGDIKAFVHYAVINKMNPESDWKHTLLLGAGVKLANGKYMQRNATKQRFLPQFQIGSGSTDLTINGVYSIQYKNTGANLESGLWLKQANELDYHFGNQLYVNTTFYWRKPIGGTTLLPSVNYTFEHIEQDEQYGIPSEFTGSTSSFLGIGGSFIRTKWSGQVLLSVPAAQKVKTGASTNSVRFTIGVQYLI